MVRQSLTLQQVAEILQVNYRRAAELAREGVLPVIRLGRQVRVCPVRLDEFIANGGKSLPGGWRRRAV